MPSHGKGIRLHITECSLLLRKVSCLSSKCDFFFCALGCDLPGCQSPNLQYTAILGRAFPLVTIITGTLNSFTSTSY